MARLTIERCKFDHFELVAIGSERAKQLVSGAVPTRPKGDDKYPVLALREIEEDNIDIEQLKDRIVSKYQEHANQDAPEEEKDEAVSAEFVEDTSDFSTGEHDFAGFDDMSIEDFGADNIFSDDISNEEDK